MYAGNLRSRPVAVYDVLTEAAEKVGCFHCVRVAPAEEALLADEFEVIVISTIGCTLSALIEGEVLVPLVLGLPTLPPLLLRALVL